MTSESGNPNKAVGHTAPPDLSKVLDALRELCWYSIHHEGWQDDHDDILKRAEATLTAHGIHPRSFDGGRRRTTS